VNNASTVFIVAVDEVIVDVALEVHWQVVAVFSCTVTSGW